MIASITLAFSVACEKNDEFANAPTVKAKEGEATAPIKDSPTQTPPNHPPIGQNAATPPAAGGFGAQVRFASVEEFGKKGPLLWTAPEGWTAAKPASSMRLAEYVVPGLDGQEPGTVSIFHFGASGGGGVEANVDRWVGQFKTPEGGKPTANRETKTVNKLTVHLVDAEGNFNAGMAGNGQTKENYKMRGAIVESPGGLFFFKLVGPKATIDARAADFDAFTASFKPGGS